MKTHLKRVLCALFALALVFAMTACGNGGETSSDNSPKPPTSSSEGEIEAIKPDVEEGSKYADPNWDPYATMSPSIKGTTVRYATWMDHTKGQGAVPFANIESDIGIKVETFQVPQFTYAQSIMTKMQAGDIPDAFKTNEQNDSFPITLQIAAPINKVSTVDLKEPFFDQSFIEYNTMEGNVYFVQAIGSPWRGGNMVFFNKTLFEDNGFKTPAEYYEEGNWTWDNFAKCCRDVMSLGDDYSGAYLEHDIMSASVGASFVQYDYKTHSFKSGINNPDLVDIYKWYAEARLDGIFAGNPGADFIQGKAAMYVRGPHGLKSDGYFSTMDPEDIGFTFLPSLEGKKGYTSSIHRGYGIIDGAPNADAAGYFLRYWLDPDNYDLSTTFLTTEAGQFYYKVTNVSAFDKYYNFDTPCALFIGESGQGVFNGNVKPQAAVNVKSAIDSVSNIVDSAVEGCNSLINFKIQADKDKYK